MVDIVARIDIGGEHIRAVAVPALLINVRGVYVDRDTIYFYLDKTVYGTSIVSDYIKSLNIDDQAKLRAWLALL